MSLSACIVLTVLASTQERYSGFGAALDSLGDLDGDGASEHLVGAPYLDSHGGTCGSAWILAGRDGRVLFALDGERAGEGFGARVCAVGDVDGDGIGDAAVAAPLAGDRRQGRVDVFSGRTGARILGVAGDGEVGFGRSLSALGTIDGIPRLAVAASESADGTFAARVRILSLADGTTLWSLCLPEARPSFGESPQHVLGRAGDVDGDGALDLAIGTPRLAGERALVISGRDFRPLLALEPPRLARRFGASLACIGDADGDGRADVAAGTPCSPDPPGYTYVFPAAGGIALYRVRGGDLVEPVGDVDGDGARDFAVVDRQCAGAADEPAFGSVSVRSSADGRELFTLWGEPDGLEAGFSLAAAGDVDGDGCADLLVGFGGGPDEPGARTTVRVIAGADGSVLRQLTFEAALADLRH